MKFRLTPLIVTVMVVVAALIGGIIAGLTFAVVELRDSGRDATRAEQTIALAVRLERNVIDMETGERGFLVSRDEQFLAPYQAARRSLPRLLRTFETASDVRAQNDRARQIGDGVRA